MNAVERLLGAVRDAPLLLWRFTLCRGRRLLQPGAGRTDDARSDEAQHAIQPAVHLGTCWKSLEAGTGPCLSLIAHGVEVLRFDCFGDGRGHYHANREDWTGLLRDASNRMYFVETTIDAQIERSAAELRLNAHYHMQRSWNRRVQRTQLDEDRLESATREAVERMRELVATHL